MLPMIESPAQQYQRKNRFPHLMIPNQYLLNMIGTDLAMVKG